MKKYLALAILFFSAPLMSFPFKNVFLKGEPGDFGVYQNGDFVTLVHIHSKKDPYITFEEITLPKKLYKKIRGKELHKWVQNGAEGNSSWTLIEIDSNTLEVTSAYCFSRHAHLDITKEDTLISSLLALDVSEVPEAERQRIGPRRNTKKDHRLFWEPPMYILGERKTPKHMDVFGGTWQKDDSPLSGKEIDIYVLDNFPFPYWIQIRGDLGLKKMVAIDSGKHLISPIKEVPKMPPCFLSKLEKWGESDSFSFLVKASRTPEQMTLYFVEIGKKENKLIPMEAKYHSIESTVLKFKVLRKRLEQELSKGKAYRLYLSYNEGEEIKSIVSKDIIHWN